MPLDAETGIYTFDDGPELRDLERLYGGLRRELAGKGPESDQAAEKPGLPSASVPAVVLKAS